MEKGVLCPLKLWVPPKEAISSCFLPPTLPPLWMLFLESICTFFHWIFQCGGAWWVPLTGLSWLPSRLACSPLLFHQAPSPHPSIFDGFRYRLFHCIIVIQAQNKNLSTIIKLFFFITPVTKYNSPSEANLWFLIDHWFIVSCWWSLHPSQEIDTQW